MRGKRDFLSLSFCIYRVHIYLYEWGLRKSDGKLSYRAIHTSTHVYRVRTYRGMHSEAGYTSLS